MTHRSPGFHAYCFMTGGPLLCVIVGLVVAGLRRLTRLRIAFAGVYVFTQDFGLLRAGHLRRGVVFQFDVLGWRHALCWNLATMRAVEDRSTHSFPSRSPSSVFLHTLSNAERGHLADQR